MAMLPEKKIFGDTIFLLYTLIAPGYKGPIETLTNNGDNQMPNSPAHGILVATALSLVIWAIIILMFAIA